MNITGDCIFNICFSVSESGSITFNEFANTYLNKQTNAKSGYSQECLKEVFKKVDKDNDGSLTKQECIQAMKMLRKNLDERGLTRVMQLMDKNNDGGISFCGKILFMFYFRLSIEVCCR